MTSTLDKSSVQVSQYRPWLDGIRAIAVVAVFLYHVQLPFLPGGFLGVDLFFVLSGYLISNILMNEYETRRKISFINFWARRIRRLFPAVALLIIAVSIYGRLFAERYENYTFRRDGIATLFYSANWWFISTGRSYFDQFSDSSVLRHMWSLAVEEQFYFLWPILFSILLSRFSPMRIKRMLLVSISLSSITLFYLFSTSSASRAYFGTDARAHQLLVGAIGAFWLRETRQRGGELKVKDSLSRLALLVSAIALIGFLLLLHDDSKFYYFGGSLIFSLCALLLLLSLDLHKSSIRRALSIRPLVGLGKISYGFYLWHWPAIVLFPTQLFPVNSRIDRLLIILMEFAVTLIASIASYLLVERPIRTGRRWTVSIKRTYIGFLSMLFLTTSVLFYGTASQGIPEWATKVPPGTFVELGSKEPSAPVVAVVGDSIARSLLPGLDTAGKQVGIRIIGSAWAGCGPGVEYLLTADGRSDWEYSRRCDDAVPGVYADLISKYNPSVILWHSVIERFPFRRGDGSIVTPGTAAYESAVNENFERAYKLMTAKGAKVLLSEVVLKAQRFKGECKMYPDSVDCRADDGSDGVYPAMNQRIQQFVAMHPASKLFPLSDLVCPGKQKTCPTYVNHVMLRYDGSHLTDRGTSLVGGPLLRTIINASGITPLHPEKISQITLRRTGK